MSPGLDGSILAGSTYLGLGKAGGLSGRNLPKEVVARITAGTLGRDVVRIVGVVPIPTIANAIRSPATAVAACGLGISTGTARYTASGTGIPTQNATGAAADGAGGCVVGAIRIDTKSSATRQHTGDGLTTTGRRTVCRYDAGLVHTGIVATCSGTGVARAGINRRASRAANTCTGTGVYDTGATT